MLLHSLDRYTEGLRARMHDPAQLLRRDFTFTGLLDLAVVFSWLAVVIARVRPRVYLLLSIFTLGAAAFTFVRHTAYYAPPAQQALDSTSPAEFAREHALKPEPQGTILRDIGPGDEDLGHWANDRPAVQFTPKDPHGWTFYASFLTVGDILRFTGPQTIRLTINGVAIDTKVFPVPGTQEFRYAVDPSWLKPDVPNTGGMDVQPIRVMPDGARLSVIILSMGFLEDLEK